MTLIGRNETCYCGSGKKYKKCCLQKDHTGGIRFETSRVVHTKHDLIDGIQALALGQFEQLTAYLTQPIKYDSHIEFTSRELVKLATATNIEDHFLQVVKEVLEAKGASSLEISMELSGYRKIAKNRPRLSIAECQVIQTVAESILDEYMLLTDMQTADYGSMRTIAQFGYEIIQKGISDGNYAKKVYLYTDTGDKLINWDVEWGEDLHEYIDLVFKPLDELHHEYEKYAHALHGLEQESINSLVTALLRESTFPKKSSDKLSYIGLAMHYIGILEQELRLVISLNEKRDKSKQMMWAEICTYVKNNALPYLSENIPDFAQQLKSLHPIRNKIAHGEMITVDEFNRIKSFAIDKQVLEFISWAKIHYEEV